MSELHRRRLPAIRWHEPKSSYDVVIIGGGGHGLATAYYLATRHGITNVAVLEADYIASGNTGRNTTIIRAQLRRSPRRSASTALPRAVRRRSRPRPAPRSSTRPRASSGSPTPRWRMRTERARVPMNKACGVEDRAWSTRPRSRSCVPQIDLTGGGRYPVLGASHHVEAATARHDRVAWAYAAGAIAARRPRRPAHAGDRPRCATATGSSASRRRADRSPPASS